MTAERHKVILEQITVVGADTATLKLVVQDRKDGYDTCDCKIDLRAFFIKKVEERTECGNNNSRSYRLQFQRHHHSYIPSMMVEKYASYLKTKEDQRRIATALYLRQGTNCRRHVCLVPKELYLNLSLGKQMCNNVN